MRYYAKLGYNDEPGSVLQKFADAGIATDEVIIDEEKKQKQQNSIYSALKRELMASREMLCVDSLFSLGKNAREITKEIGWYRDHGIRVCALDIPSSMSSNADPMDLLYEIDKAYASREVKNLKAGQKTAARKHRTAGRPAQPYPPNWDELYEQYENKEITFSEILERTGLSRGTFFNLQRKYLRERMDADNGSQEQDDKLA